MLEIKGKSIYLTRGDYAEIIVSVLDNDTGQAHTFAEGEVVIFRIGGTDIEKECNIITGESTCTLKLEEKDTADLRFGHYKYEFEYRNVYGKPSSEPSGGKINLINKTALPTGIYSINAAVAIK